VIYAANGSSSGGNSFLPMLLLFGLLALMYFMVIRPQSQRRKQMQQMQESVAVGSAVLTIGGLYGTVVSVDDESVTLEVSPGVTNRYARGAIAKVLPDDTAEPADAGEPAVAEDNPATPGDDKKA
jgi:preprotein translocase subunit YajC